jgi:hypothetical protein
MVTFIMAQVMTRGMVKYRLMYERKWEIRSQAPYGCAVHRLNVGWRKLKI